MLQFRYDVSFYAKVKHAKWSREACKEAFGALLAVLNPDTIWSTISKQNEDGSFTVELKNDGDSSKMADPCISPMGKNICASQQPQPEQQMCSVNYGSTVGLVPCK